MITNKTKNIVLEKKYKYCKNTFTQLIGLMFQTRKTLIFDFKKEKKNSLHMFFVFFPIDVFFLDNNKIVVDVKKKFEPFTYYISKKKSRYVIELPYSLNNNTEIGDQMEFK